VDVSRDRPIKAISWAAVSNRRLDAWKAPRHGCALKRSCAPCGLSSAITRWLFRKGRCAASDADCSHRRNARDEWLEFIVGQISRTAFPEFQDSNSESQRGGHWSPKKRNPACSRRRNGDSTTPEARRPARVGRGECAVGVRRYLIPTSRDIWTIGETPLAGARGYQQSKTYLTLVWVGPSRNEHDSRNPPSLSRIRAVEIGKTA
jgi:hypothetical protein